MINKKEFDLLLKEISQIESKIVEIKVLNSMLKSDGLGKSEIKVEVDKHE